jgi:hypothetical protein
MKHPFFALIIIIITSTLLGSCKKKEVMSLPVLTTTVVTNITANSAQSGGQISSNGGSAISQSGICYAIHNNPSLSDSIVSNGATTASSFTSSLVNLNANTVYYVRAFATNGDGTAFGNVDSFTTSQGLASIITTAITNNQALAANSGWTLTNNGGSAITAIGICWSTSPNPTTTNYKTSDTITATSAADTLQNLSLTTYYIRAYATNSAGTAYGNQITLVVSTTGTVADIDGNAYGTITIGTQIWMTSNLRVTHYQNGDSIVDGYLDPSYPWGNPPGGAYTFVNADSTTKATYGLLYDQPAVVDSRNIAPAGWRVATDGDWETLEFY